MITTLYLVRHGETAGADVRRYKGSIDVPLSDRGTEQMEKVSLFIRGHINRPLNQPDYLRDVHGVTEGKEVRPGGLSSVYTSNLIRAVRSAEIISRPYDTEPVQIADFRERNFGIWEGMTFSEIKGKYPVEFDSWASNPLKHSPVGGESTEEVRERVVRTLRRIIDDHKGENIAIVSHGGVIRVILCHVLGIPMENIFRIEQDYAALNIIEFWEKYPVVKLMNYPV